MTSASHPEGVRSIVDGYPKSFDSRSYNATEQTPNGDETIALIVAQAEFADRVKQNVIANNPARVMWTVTLERSDGRQIDRKVFGAFPDMTPVPPEPTPEPEEEQ